MKAVGLRETFLSLITSIGAACAWAGTMTTEPVFHNLEFGNDGKGVVRDVAVTYGDIRVPAGNAHKVFGPNHMATVTEVRTLPVPENATIEWSSADGQHHEATAPMRSLIQDPNCFHGFRFFFVDDHVDIYLLSRKHDCSKVLDVGRTKVYTTH